MAQDLDGSYRVFYVAKLDDVVWVLHAFQKKTKQTSKVDVQRGKEAYSTLLRHLAKGRKGRGERDQ
jgi:phage-related protein